MNNKNEIIPIISGIIYSTLFGLTFMFSSIALRFTSPFALLSMRFGIAFIVMSILVFFKIIKINFKNKDLKTLFLLGLMQPILYFIFETYAIKNTATSVAGTLIALIPISVAISSSYFLKEKPTKAQYSFILASIVGVIIIVVLGGQNNARGNFMGIILLFGAVISATIFNLLSRKLSTTFTPAETTYFMMGIAFFVFTLIALVEGLSQGTLNKFFLPFYNLDFLLSLLFLGVMASIIGFFLVNFTLSKMEATKASVFSNLSTVVSIIAGVIFLDESFKLFQIIGAILILIGVWGTNKFGQNNNNQE